MSSPHRWSRRPCKVSGEATLWPPPILSCDFPVRERGAEKEKGWKEGGRKDGEGEGGKESGTKKEGGRVGGSTE